MSGTDVLEGPELWAGKYIPLLIGYCQQGWRNGVHWYRGIVRPAMDPQKFHNFAFSANATKCAESIPDFYWMTSTQVGQNQKRLERINVDRLPIQVFEPDPKSPGAPQKSGGSTIDSNLFSMLKESEQAIQATLGMHDASMGYNPASQSGRAVMALQRQGDISNAPLLGGFDKMMVHLGEQLIDLNPRIFTHEAQRRIMNEDGTSELVYINQQIKDQQTGKEVMLNNLQSGRYSIKADLRPSFQTKRQEALAFMTEFARNNPIIQQVAPDLMVKMMDMPYSKDLIARLRKPLVEQGIAEPTDEEKAERQGREPDPAALMQQELMKIELQLKAAELDERDLNLSKTRAEVAELLAKVSNMMKPEGVALPGDAQVAAQATNEVQRVFAQPMPQQQEQLPPMPMDQPMEMAMQ